MNHKLRTLITIAQTGSTGTGACTCAVASFETCTCDWGDLIREMMALGYHADPVFRAQLMPALQKRFLRVTAAARATAVEAAAADWPGTQIELARHLGISPGRIRQYRAAA